MFLYLNSINQKEKTSYRRVARPEGLEPSTSNFGD
jgi:hypothetical protein